MRPDKQGSVTDKTEANLADMQLEQERFKLTWLDYIAAPVIALLAAVWTMPYVGTSINFDDLFYMNLSQYTTPQTWVLNRYGHVYLQKFFFWIVSDAITGTRLYWCFLFFGTCVLVYWCARMLAGKKGYIIGLVATLFFVSQPLFIKLVGGTLADLTVMFLLMLGSYVYLDFLVGRNKGKHFVLMVLGLIFFWAVKSKETGICMGVLFFALGKDKTGFYSIRQFIKDIGWVCLGMIAGCLLLMGLDMIFMDDFWFSVRPSNIRGLFEFNTGEFAHDQRNNSWYAIMSLQPILPAFMLYLLVGRNTPDCRRLSRYESMVWLIPLAVLFFMTAIIVKMRQDSAPRYLMPAIPFICIWGAQFFCFDSNSMSNKNNISTNIETQRSFTKIFISLVIILFAFIVTWIVMSKAPDFVRDAGWKSQGRVYICIILPLATTVLLICACLVKKQGLGTLFLFSLCLFFIVYFPFSSNLKSLKQRSVAKRSEWRYEPYRVFADEFLFNKNVKILVSADIYKRSWMLGREARAHGWMFNVFFNQKFECGSNFNFEHAIGQFVDGSWEDILKGDYTYGLLTWRDWNGIREKHDTEQLLRKYVLKTDRKTQLILLKKR